MLPRRLLPCLVALACASLAVAPRGAAQLVSKSPFLPPQSSAPAPTQSAPLEFLGFLKTADGLQYRIYDPAKKAGAWVKIDERNPEFDVIAKQHNADQETLTVEHQGRTITLAARVGKVVSSGNIPQPMPPPVAPPMANVAPAVTQSVVLNPTPADEQRRLEAVAAEVARRRALREQAQQQMNQGMQPQMAMPQPQIVQPQRNFQQQQQNNNNPRRQGRPQRQ